MKLLFELVIAMAVALGVGLGSAWYIVGDGWLLRTDVFNEWAAWPMSGSPDADPYSRAILARTGQVPLASGEGMAFVASTDMSGKPIRGGCDYVVVGATPAVRLWTLTLMDGKGDLPANAANRQYLRSDRILRSGNGEVRIALSPQARPGNWLPLPGTGTYSLVLRLYDTPASLLTDIRGGALPRIEPWGCP